jgi:hypothetical protein
MYGLRRRRRYHVDPDSKLAVEGFFEGLFQPLCALALPQPGERSRSIQRLEDVYLGRDDHRQVGVLPPIV